MTLVLKPDDSGIKIAADIIRKGGTVVFPTETVYGLGANALSSEASAKIFRAKDRPADNPLIVTVSNFNMVKDVSYIDCKLLKIMEGVWPAPLTLLLKKKSIVPDIVTAGMDTVCVRFPKNEIALRLISEAGVPVAAPSANIATRPSIVDSKDAIDELDGRVDAIIDAGRVEYGVESTIIDATVEPYNLLRPGAFPVEEIERLFGKININPVARGYKESNIALTPGMKYRHYAPSKKLILIENIDDFRSFVSSDRARDFLALCSSENSKYVKYDKIILGRDAYEAAHNLFYDFRLLDRSDKQYGVIQAFPETGIGFGLMNRIRKASWKIIKDGEKIEI
ncbi:L-threonylcarbamoyladenylate synthase [Picrophilus oshimae]|uniref:Threonylcarbamoyl-AMP synthase n=1 Tax=Picrophilus torridus (strain ATCC 700027 / DSM 9790 / JCM 10055 / NBRC 100828 / KAW 2/3) TaxID=1122961 RepID=Q6L0H3_PICTO|nr:L-threonylcarbamoyladenylate synthase [Picrophilus oshimae]AAT43529.1 Sua5 superfamily-related protein [Picrophilus oshimae DSM 9789]SMD30159.1 translation factor SUA5 [Picrophilus oshimae DSM 9789]